ncbi:MAG: histone deacetylase [Chitinispirillia bacterium]|jgi:acetoin utilization deacetylase AcuC-like enzyme
MDTNSVKSNRRSFLKDLSYGTAALGLYSCVGSNDFINKNEKRTGYIYDKRMLNHIISPRHVESPERIKKINERIIAEGIFQEVMHLTPLENSIDFIKKVHSHRHVSNIKKIPITGTAAKISTSCALAASKAVCEGKISNAFCAIRPPGHHAHNSGAEEGFCYYNNVAIATRYIQEVYNIKKILIIDWDFHHGNATQDTFYNNGSVLFFSTHNWHAYPGTGNPSLTGEGEGAGLNINVHLDDGANDDEMKRAWEKKLLPKVETFQPEFVFISAGFDSRKDDILGTFKITDNCFATLTRFALDIAGNYSKNRLVSLLEGGYNVEGTASAVVSHISQLINGSSY